MLRFWYLCAWSCFSQWTSLTSRPTFTSLSFTASYTCTSPIRLTRHLSCPQLDYACRSFQLIFIDSTPAAQKSTREMGTEREGGEKREWEESKDMEATRENAIRRELERRRYAKVKNAGLSWRVWFSPPTLPAESFLITCTAAWRSFLKEETIYSSQAFRDATGPATRPDNIYIFKGLIDRSSAWNANEWEKQPWWCFY